MPDLDRMLCFALYSASRSVTQAYRALLEPRGITYPQYLVVVALESRGPRSVGQLGDDLLLDSGTLSPLLRRLEERDLVARSRDAADERVVTVGLTESGRRLAHDLHSVPDGISACLGTSADDVPALLDALHRLRGNVRERSARTAA